MTPELEVGAAVIRTWRRDILAWHRANWPGAELDTWQAEALTAFASPDPAQRRISLQACAGPGKTAVLALCGLWFLGVWGDTGEHPKGAAVSITSSNLSDNLWSEMSKWMQRSAFYSRAFTWTASRIYATDHPETWFLSARGWPKTASTEEQGKTLSGLHSKFVCVLIDEAGAIPLAVLRAGEQALSNCVFGKIAIAGNPISLDGMLHAAATSQRHLWHVIRVTGDPDDPQRSPRIDLTWATEQIRLYSRSNPWVQSYILGQFPPASINQLLGIEDVEAAMRRHLPEASYSFAQRRLGVDVARYGDDRTVIFGRQGLASFRPIIMRHDRGSAVSIDIANRCLAAQARWGSEAVLIDATGGWGAGARDVLVSQGVPVIEVQAAAPAIDPRYLNRRAECWLSMATWIQGGAALPNLPELVGELTAPTFSFTNGKFVLESKDQIKKRLGKSPDLADALALTFGLPDQPRGLVGSRSGVGHALTDFDPYAEIPRRAF